LRLLVTGGAGYIGAAVAHRLREAGHTVVVIDDLSTGHREAVEGRDLVVGDYGDLPFLEEVLRARRIEGIVHMAARCLVEESTRDPAPYYRDNVGGSLRLLGAACRRSVGVFVFSSSAAVYGEPERVPIDEEHPVRPTNPYGETKLAFERALAWFGAAYGIRTTCLRYFNAAGATRDGLVGEVHHPETHLVPNVLRAAQRGEAVPVYGSDYPTPDGTAVRDYVHIEDLAEAHRLAVERTASAPKSAVFNLGNGNGFSVLEVIEAARRVTGRPIAVRPEPRRPGDPARLVAAAVRARADLRWAPAASDLETILETAWRYQQARGV
jgi:UDP-glucose-4-epimerase GalE